MQSHESMINDQWLIDTQPGDIVADLTTGLVNGINIWLWNAWDRETAHAQLIDICNQYICDEKLELVDHGSKFRLQSDQFIRTRTIVCLLGFLLLWLHLVNGGNLSVSGHFNQSSKLINCIYRLMAFQQSQNAGRPLRWTGRNSLADDIWSIYPDHSQL